jgi:molybdopterin/thiamine biosynthesis adenylyltransferase
VAKGVLIVGLGGLGVPAALAAARGGVRRLGLVDPDPVELSNLARQVIYREADLGKLKVDAAADRLKRLAPDLEIESFGFALEAPNAARVIENFGFVIDATDSPAAKFLINDVCVGAGIPFIYGGVLGLTGQAMTVIPGRTACLRCLFEKPPGEAEIASCREAGIIGPVAGAIGLLQGAEAARWASGETLRCAGMIVTYDGAHGANSRTIAMRARVGCSCGASRADTAPAAGSPRLTGDL